MKFSIKDKLLSLLPEHKNHSNLDILSIHGTRHIRILTDEGLTLNLPIASITLRLVALAIDMTILSILFGIWSRVVADWFASNEFSSLAVTVAAFSAILLVSLNPLLAELLFRGRSIGAMVAGLDIVHERGEELTRSAIAVRRITSYLEPLVPMWFVFSIPALDSSVVGQILLMIFAAFAQSLHVFLSPARQRLSERFARVVVVEKPSSIVWHNPIPRTSGSELRLSPQQLDFYGSYELHVMEQCLHAYAQKDRRLVKKAASAIRTKLGIPSAIEDYDLVLSCYNQLKDDLEAKQRVGGLRLRKLPGSIGQF